MFCNMYSSVKFPFTNILKMSFGASLGKNICTGNKYNNLYSIEMLNNRGLLRVHGTEASTFLQGLITNDMKHIEEGAQSMYSMFLNVRGRVLCDSLIYKELDDTFLIESDKDALITLQKHLKMYRVRKQIDIDIYDNYNIWVIFPTTKDNSSHSLPKENINHNFLDTYTIKNIQEKSKIMCRDPRLAELGYRIIAPIQENLSDKYCGEEKVNSESYKMLRYKLGVGEGVAEIPPGKSFPLELNSDFLHGVSFHKGCYIGQELTARVYHTGVIRKRLMPLILHNQPSESFLVDTVIENAMNKSAVGKLRGLEKSYGLGLMKINEALNSPALDVLNVTGITFKPHWWPQEAPKERSVAGKEVG